MKIFYAIQATGNGHIARAMELMPFLHQYGTVDVFLSGSNSNLQFDLPIKYRSKGVSLFYGNSGKLDYWKMWKELSIKRIWKEAKDLPVEQYDVVINDFESITSLACKLKKVSSIGFGHQASFQSALTPRAAKKDIAGEFILKNYARAKAFVGLHFKQYDDFIFSPVIKYDILQAQPKDDNYIAVYLSHYADEIVAAQLHRVKNMRFKVFSKKVKHIIVENNITYLPIDTKLFNESLINCSGIITGAGFETPAEALYLEKKLLCLPIKGQYEQWCNAAALKSFGVPVVKTIDEHFPALITAWMEKQAPEKLLLQQDTAYIVQQVMDRAKQLMPLQEENDSMLQNALAVM